MPIVRGYRSRLPSSDWRNEHAGMGDKASLASSTRNPFTIETAECGVGYGKAVLSPPHPIANPTSNDPAASSRPRQ
jgi:hypothetical protein